MAAFIDSEDWRASAPIAPPAAPSASKVSMYTSKPNSSDAQPPSKHLLVGRPLSKRRNAVHRLRNRGGVDVRYETQASARVSSGVRGKVQARKCGP